MLDIAAMTALHAGRRGKAGWSSGETNRLKYKQQEEVYG
jgi:hypothetical protein